MRRVYRATTRCTVTLLTERRRLAPHGANGGENGAPGRNALDGSDVSAKTRQTLEPGATLRIETPGGGGWGTVG